VSSNRSLAVVVEAPRNPVKGLHSLQKDPYAITGNLHAVDSTQCSQRHVQIRINDLLEKLLNLL
jgi:hypothetical protein